MYDFILYQARDVMTANPVTVSQDISIREAEAIFEEHDFNGLPVLGRDQQLIGLVTKLDILKAFAFTKTFKIPPYDAIMGREVAQVMTRDPDIVEPETPLTRVLQIMIETGYKSLPVLEGARLAGIVAREDILGALRWAALGKKPDRPDAA